MAIFGHLCNGSQYYVHGLGHANAGAETAPTVLGFWFQLHHLDWWFQKHSSKLHTSVCLLAHCSWYMPSIADEGWMNERQCNLFKRKR